MGREIRFISVPDKVPGTGNPPGNPPGNPLPDTSGTRYAGRMEPFILWTKQHFPLLHEILFHGEWWPSEAGAAYISLTITVYLVIKQLKLARTQNDIQAAMHALSLLS